MNGVVGRLVVAVVAPVLLAGGLVVVAATPASALPPVRPTLAETQGRVSVSDGDGQILDVDPDGTVHQLGILGQAQTWSPDGSKLAYVTLDNFEIRVADADGSNDHVLVAADPALVDIGRGYLNLPTWSPDGNRIAYAAWSEVCGPAHNVDRGWAIYAVDVDGSNVEKLSPPVTHWLANFTICREIGEGVSWGPGGKIAFATDDTQEFWSRSISTFKTPKGDIVVLDVNAHTERNLTWDDPDDRHYNVWPTWTGDGRIAYAGSDFLGLPEEVGKPDIRMRNVDGSGEVNLTTSPDEYELLSAWSPSGSHVAFVATSAEDPDARNLYLMKSAGTGVITHSRIDQGFRSLTWHPTPPPKPTVAELGGRISVSTGDHKILDVDPDGTIHDLGIEGLFPTWNPAGTKVAFLRNNDFELWVANADGSDQHRVAIASEASRNAGMGYLHNTSWSPDGTQIAYVSAEEHCLFADSNSYGDAVFVVTLATGATRQVSSTVIDRFWDFPTCRTMWNGMAWGPTGEIAVSTEDSQVFWDTWYATRGFMGTHHDIVIIDPATATERTITFGDAQDSHFYLYPAWTPDGRVGFSGADFGPSGGTGIGDIRVRNADGSHEVNLTNSPNNHDLYPAWSPSGTHVAYVSGEVSSAEGDDHLMLMKADGSRSYDVGDIPYGAVTVAWHPMPATSPDVTITSCDPSALAAVTSVTGNLIIDVSCASLTLPNLVSVGGDILLTGATSLTTLQLPALTTVGGDMVVSCNPTLTTIAAPELGSVGGDMKFTANVALATLTTPELDTVGGDMDFSANPTVTGISAPQLDNVGGDMDVTGNTTMTTISVPTVTVIGGDMTMTGNPTLTTIAAPTVTTIGGDMEVSANDLLTQLSLPELSTVAGDMHLSAEATVTVRDCATGQPGPPTAVSGGDMDLVSMPSLTLIGGDVDVSSGTDLDLATGGGATTVSMLGGLAAMTLALPHGTFDQSTGFSITALPATALDPVDGTSGDGPVSVDPLSGYAFTFDVPTLDKDAALTFVLDLAGLDDDLEATVRAALADGTLTLWTKNDAGATQAFPVCGAGVTPAAGVCVSVSVDGDHVTFAGVVGHFSSYGIGVVSALAVPEVTTQPVDTEVEAGETATFTSAASGIPTPSVLWQSSTHDDQWADVAGEDDATLEVVTAAADDGTRYRAVWTNRLGSATSDAATLTVTTLVVDPPPVAHAGGPYSVVEGASLSLDASASSADSTAFTWDLDNDGQYDDATGATPVVTPAQLAILRDGPAAATVSVRVTDAAGQAATAQTGLTVTNAVPTAGVAPASGAANVGAPYAVTLSATDPSGTDTTAGFDYSVAWGDGTTSASASHTYSAPGTFAISVTATDKDAGTSASVTASVVVTAPAVATAALVQDVCRPLLTSVVVRGTPGADVISIAPAKSLVGVTVNGRLLGTFAPTGRIAVYAGDGNDTVTIDPKVSRDVVILGGLGNDAITSDQGTGIYVGGPGNDTITAGKSRDLVLGGLGTDTLRAGQGDDLLVAGATSYDDDLSSLCAIADRWGRADLTYSARVDLVRALTGPLMGASDDAARDDLKGEQGQDWFVARPGAVPPGDVTDRAAATEVLTLLT